MQTTQLDENSVSFVKTLSNMNHFCISCATTPFTVTDSGRGIPQVIANKMFNKFFTTKSVGKGTGLGLSISKQIIEKHNGILELDYNSPYTKFIIKFPKNRKEFDIIHSTKIA